MGGLSGAQRVDPRVDRTREAVLAAVRELLIDEGWEAVSQNRVAQRSGVGRSTVYRHWPDRNDLVREAMDFELRRTRDVVLTGCLRTDLIAALEAIRYEIVEREGSKFLAAMIARAEWDAGAQPVKKALVDRAIETLRTVIDAAIRDGELRQRQDPSLMLSQLVGPLVMRRLVTDESLDHDVVTHLVDDFLGGDVR
jgi:AcrR family transcriptional regulator